MRISAVLRYRALGAALTLALVSALSLWPDATAYAAPAPDQPTTITAVSGGGQSVEAHQVFAEPLVAKVTDAAGAPVAGVPVTFTLPSYDDPNDNVTFPDGTTEKAVITGADGTATTESLYANRPIGKVTASATFPGAATPAPWSLTVTEPANAKADLSPFIGGADTAKRKHHLRVSVSAYDAGPDVADFITLLVSLPHGWRVSDVGGYGKRVGKRKIEFLVDTLDPGAESIFIFTVKTGKHRGHYTLKAKISSSTPDPDKSNDTYREKIKLS